jgi:hypothetical protein
MTAENAPAVRAVCAECVVTDKDLDDLLAHLHRNWNNDPEAAHALEDEIKTRVLQLAADGHPDAARLAAKVLEIDAWDDVTRWFA